MGHLTFPSSHHLEGSAKDVGIHLALTRQHHTEPFPSSFGSLFSVTPT